MEPLMVWERNIPPVLGDLKQPSARAPNHFKLVERSFASYGVPTYFISKLLPIVKQIFETPQNSETSVDYRKKTG